MLKEKWKKLLLREKLLLISGILFILSIPIAVIIENMIVMLVPLTLFIIFAFCNLYKFMKVNKITIKDIEKETQKGYKEWENGKKFTGAVRMIALPMALGVGVVVLVGIIIILWISVF